MKPEGMSEEQLAEIEEHAAELDSLMDSSPEFCSHNREDGDILRELVAEVRLQWLKGSRLCVAYGNALMEIHDLKAQRDGFAAKAADVMAANAEAISDRDSLASRLKVATEALRWYADEVNWCAYWDKESPVVESSPAGQDDLGARARAALKNIEGGE